MSLEIERKYLVTHLDKNRLPRRGYLVIQGYLSHDPVVRVRLVDNKQVILSVKGKGLLKRAEFEYPIPLSDGRALLKLCRNRTRKIRYRIGRVELDVFQDRLKGLILAEVELQHPREKVALPDWLTAREVTSDRRYQNSYLSRYGRPE